jgi:galactitol PTS system EIIA component
MKMNSGLVAHPQLSWIGSASSWREVLQRFADLAEAEGFARPGFGAALISREEEYPTGLPMKIPLAIPHAYPEFVIQPGVGVALLDPAVEFREMGGEEDQVLSVRLVVLMLVTQETAHNADLSTIIRMFKNPEWYEKFSTAADPSELAASFQALFAQNEQAG